MFALLLFELPLDVSNLIQELTLVFLISLAAQHFQVDHLLLQLEELPLTVSRDISDLLFLFSYLVLQQLNIEVQTVNRFLQTLQLGLLDRLVEASHDAFAVGLEAIHEGLVHFA